YDDLIVGAWNASVGATGGAGRAYVFRGGTGGVATSPNQTIDGPDGAGWHFGVSVSGGGDFDQNGRCDIVAGTYNPMGAVHLYGFASSSVGTLASPDGAGGYFGASFSR